MSTNLDTGSWRSSAINGGGKWVELSIESDSVYQTVLIAAEKAFCRLSKAESRQHFAKAAHRDRHFWSLRTNTQKETRPRRPLAK